jgi:hypothetical protein
VRVAEDPLDDRFAVRLDPAHVVHLVLVAVVGFGITPDQELADPRLADQGFVVHDRLHFSKTAMAALTIVPPKL